MFVCLWFDAGSRACCFKACDPFSFPFLCCRVLFHCCWLLFVAYCFLLPVVCLFVYGLLPVVKFVVSKHVIRSVPLFFGPFVKPCS